MADQYDSSAEARYRLVDLDELDALVQAGGRPVARDAGKLVHLLTRMRGTLAAQADTISGLHRHIEQQKGHLARVGQATTLNPLDALKYLDDNQRDLLFDRISRDRLAMLRHMVTQAQNTRADLVGQLEMVRGAATAMAQRADLPPDVRVEFTRLLSYLPSEVREVRVPPLLDYPDPPPLATDPLATSSLSGADTPPAPLEAAAPGPSPSPVQGPTPLRRRLTDPAPASSETGTVSDAPGSPGSPGSPAPAVPDEPAPPVYRDPYAPAADAPAYRDPYAPAADAPAYRDPYAPATDPGTSPSVVSGLNDDERAAETGAGPPSQPPPPVRRDPRPPPGLDELFS